MLRKIDFTAVKYQVGPSWIILVSEYDKESWEKGLDGNKFLWKLILFRNFVSFVCCNLTLNSIPYISKNRDFWIESQQSNSSQVNEKTKWSFMKKFSALLFHLEIRKFTEGLEKLIFFTHFFLKLPLLEWIFSSWYLFQETKTMSKTNRQRTKFFFEKKTFEIKTFC